MLDIAIVEDEEKWQELARSEIKRYYHEEIHICCFKTGEEFLKTDRRYDMVFMDIELPGDNGFAVIEKYTAVYCDVLIIIMTTHTEMSRRGYQVNAFRYIDKHHLEEFEEALRSAEKRKRQLVPISFQVSKIGEVRVRCKDIIYIEADNHNIKIRTGTDLLICRDTMECYEQTLNELGFFHVHRSFLINLDHVSGIEKRDVIMSNGESIPISRNRQKEFGRAFFQWKFENGNA